MATRSTAELARLHQIDLVRLSRLAADAAAEAWARVDRASIARSWAAQLHRPYVAVSASQTLAAGAAEGYVSDSLAAQGIERAAAGAVQASRFAGIASDGRALEELLYQPAIRSLILIGDGVAPREALARGAVSLDMLVRTQVMDAGRGATGTAITSRGCGYVRQLAPPSCSRCVVLAGRFYRWNAGFKRHPRCDCVHIPTDAWQGVRRFTSPRQYFDRLSGAERAQVFGKAGAAAIEDGADISQVVNARRGMQVAGGRVTTTASTTRHGVARPGRLMPEQIYRDARGDRTEALRLLRLHGFIR